MQYKVGDIISRDDNLLIYNGVEWQVLCDANEVTNCQSNNTSYKETIFSCPHCGGNQTKLVNNKTVCAYCGSEIILDADIYKSKTKKSLDKCEISPSVTNDTIQQSNKSGIRYEIF